MDDVATILIDACDKQATVAIEIVEVDIVELLGSLLHITLNGTW